MRLDEEERECDVQYTLPEKLRNETMPCGSTEKNVLLYPISITDQSEVQTRCTARLAIQTKQDKPHKKQKSSHNRRRATSLLARS